jgi:dihydrofolate synthase/folylpolyglutamate synthase
MLPPRRRAPLPSREASTLHSDVILERLKQLHPKRIDLSLDRIERLLAALGHPERRLPPVIHVAGTNGKGSVVAYLESGMRAAHRRVHTYISPHLVRFHERIRLAQPDGTVAPVAEPRLAALLARCEDANGGAPITFFEITTAAAMLAFAETPADLLLLEVGLGGRLDATNVIDRPLVSVITPVSIDHVQFLGPDLAGIAAEKAGILKPGVTAVIAPQPDAALAAIAQRGGAVDAPLLRHGVEWTHEEKPDGSVTVSWRGGSLDIPPPSLAGAFQSVNAAVATLTMAVCPPGGIDAAAIRRGIAGATWPARMQNLAGHELSVRLPAGAELWLDGGHNPSAGSALADTLARWRVADPEARPLHLVVGMINTKDIAGFLAPFAPLAPQVHGVDVGGEEANAGAARIAAVARGLGMSASAADSVGAALDSIGRSAATGSAAPRVLICGSLYLAGNVLGGRV